MKASYCDASAEGRACKHAARGSGFVELADGTKAHASHQGGCKCWLPQAGESPLLVERVSIMQSVNSHQPTQAAYRVWVPPRWPPLPLPALTASATRLLCAAPGDSTTPSGNVTSCWASRETAACAGGGKSILRFFAGCPAISMTHLQCVQRYRYAPALRFRLGTSPAGAPPAALDRQSSPQPNACAGCLFLCNLSVTMYDEHNLTVTKNCRALGQQMAAHLATSC